MTTKVKALDRLIDAIAGSDVPVSAQTVAGTIDTLADTLAGDDVSFTAQDIAGRIDELAGMIEDGTITIGGGGSKFKPIADGNTHLKIISFGSYDNVVLNLLAVGNLSDLTIDWGDGTTEHPTGAAETAYTHHYANAGVYDIVLSTTNANSYFNTPSNGVFRSTDTTSGFRLIALEIGKPAFNFDESNTSAFQEARNLRNLYVFGGGEIKAYWFNHAYCLENIIFSDDPWAIGAYCFNTSYASLRLELPSTITSIGAQAFVNWRLIELVVRATTPPTLVNANAFDNSFLKVVYVPAESVDAYKAATNWSTYADKIQAIPA